MEVASLPPPLPGLLRASSSGHWRASVVAAGTLGSNLKDCTWKKHRNAVILSIIFVP